MAERNGRHRARYEGAPRGLVLAAGGLVATCGLGLLLALVLVAGPRVLSPVVSLVGGNADAPAGEGAEPSRPQAERAELVLQWWDGRRAQAYAAGDPAALAELYPADSALGASDVAVLTAYVERGLRVHDLRLTLLEVTVIEDEAHSLVLEVTDELQRASVVRAEGGAEVALLPGRAASTRILSFTRDAELWVLTGAESAG